jgi:hypothetical protein
MAEIVFNVFNDCNLFRNVNFVTSISLNLCIEYVGMEVC